MSNRPVPVESTVGRPTLSPAPRLLLIDQDPADRSRTAAALMALFPLAQLREVELGADFFEALKGSNFDIVVSEMTTRWASWPFLLGAIRALQPDASIVVYTREDDPSIRRDALAAGATACVVKTERGLLDLAQAIDRILTPSEPLESSGATSPEPSTVDPDPDRRDPASDAAKRPTASRPGGATVTSPSSEALSSREEAASSGSPPSTPSTANRGAGSPATTIADWTRGLRERDVGGPLAILAAVIALTVLLTALLAAPPAGEESNSSAERRPRGIVAGESAPVLEDQTNPLPTRPRPSPGSSDSTSASPEKARPATRRPLASDAPVAIELRPRDEVWVRLYMDGEKVLETTLEPGQNRFYEGREIADLTIGNAAALTVFWNGTDLGNLGAEGQVRRLNLSPTRVGAGAARSSS